MRFVYPATLEHGEDVVVSFRDVPHCHTSGDDVAEALVEAVDALEEAIARCIDDGDEIPMPSQPLPGEHLVALPVETAAKAALVLAFRTSGLTQADLAARLGMSEQVLRRMFDPRRRTAPDRIAKALRKLGQEVALETHDVVAASG